MKGMPGWSAPADLGNASWGLRVEYCLATTFYTGHLPASGTWGALVAFGLHAALFPALFAPAQMLWGGLLLLAVIVFGVIASNHIEAITGKKDDSRITIDEVAGYFVAVLFLPPGLAYAIPAFLLARFFDIVKLPPADGLQRLSGGWGVMIDDLVASLYALALMHVYAYTGLGETVQAWFNGLGL